MNLITHLLVYNLAISILLYGSLAYNPRMWLHRMPPEVTVKVPEKTPQERKLFIFFAIPFLLWLFEYPIFYILQQDSNLSTNFLILLAFFAGFALWDTLVLDLLIFCKMTPRFIIIEGTSREDYSNMKYHLVSGSKGLIMSLVFSGIMALVLTFLMTGSISTQSVSVHVPEPAYWPTSGWKTSPPESQGMDSELLSQMLEDISSTETRIHSVLVIRNGYMVTEAYFHPYKRDTKIHIQSVTKSVIGMLVGKAVDDRYIKSDNVKLAEYYEMNLFENPSQQKDTIRLRHLLSMSSGLDCQEFSGSSPVMEQTDGWVRFMLNRPMLAKPGKTFGYCNGNAHLLSAVIEKSTGMTTREYAKRELFEPLGILPVEESDWGSDPQKITIGGYGLHLTPTDMAKLALLYLNNGKWGGQQIIPTEWVTNSTTQHIQKEDGSGYGYLWTVYPEAGHYAALGLGGQQIHVYPSKNLIVVVTASLESYAEAPEIETMLNEYILPSIKSDDALVENPDAYSRLQVDIEIATNPVQATPSLPKTAMNVSNSVYTFDENPLGRKKLGFVFEPGKETAQLYLNDYTIIDVGLDNIYRLTMAEPFGEILLRGRWADEDTFVADYPYPMFGETILGELGETEFQFKFVGDKLEVTVQQPVFGGDAITLSGSR